MWSQKRVGKSVDDDDDEVFYPEHPRAFSPEFFEVNPHSNPVSGRNSLSSISELANDEEVARFMGYEAQAHRRNSKNIGPVGHDPRYELFCKWLEAQNAPVVVIPAESLEESGDEFHDVEKEASPPQCVKDMVRAEENCKPKTIPVIPTISVPVPLKPSSTSNNCDVFVSRQTPGPETTDPLITGEVIIDPNKTVHRKLHSPKKGRAPEPPKSPVNLIGGAEEAQKNLHLETII